MSNRLEDLLSRQFRAFDEAQRPIVVLDVLESDRPVIEAKPVSLGSDRLAGRSVSVFAALATIAVVVVLMLFMAPSETADPTNPVAIPLPSTGETTDVTTPTIVPDGATTTSINPSVLDLPEPILAGDALDHGWIVVERQFDLTSFAEPVRDVSESAGLYWRLAGSGTSDFQLYVSDDGANWEPVGGGLPLFPGLFENIEWTTLLRIGDTIVATFHWPNEEAVWVSKDRGRSFERVDNQEFENVVFAWSWVAGDTFWQIVEDPERSNNLVPLAGQRSNDPVPLVGERVNDETRPRRLWSSQDGASWSLVGDVDGLPAWDGGDGYAGGTQNNFGPHAVDTENGLLLLVNRRTFRGPDLPMIFRSEDAGLTWRAFSSFPPGQGRTATIGGWIVSGHNSVGFAIPGGVGVQRFGFKSIWYVSNDGITWYHLDADAPPRVELVEPADLVTQRVAIPPTN